MKLLLFYLIILVSFVLSQGKGKESIDGNSGNRSPRLSSKWRKMLPFRNSKKASAQTSSSDENVPTNRYPHIVGNDRGTPMRPNPAPFVPIVPYSQIVSESSESSNQRAQRPRSAALGKVGGTNLPSKSPFILIAGTAAKGKDQSSTPLPKDKYVSKSAGDDSYYAKKNLMIVADGVGGAANSNLYSRILTHHIVQAFEKQSHNSDPKKILESAYSITQEEFKDARGYQGSTTAVFTYFDVRLI